MPAQIRQISQLLSIPKTGPLEVQYPTRRRITLATGQSLRKTMLVSGPWATLYVDVVLT